jgi:hypothetical protein
MRLCAILRASAKRSENASYWNHAEFRCDLKGDALKDPRRASSMMGHRWLCTLIDCPHRARSCRRSSLVLRRNMKGHMNGGVSEGVAMATQDDSPSNDAELPLTPSNFQNGSSSRLCAPAGCSTPRSISSLIELS